jgi:hypothetical protein
VRMRPVSAASLVDELAERISGIAGWVRVGVDGSDAARPGDLADKLASPIRLRGRPVTRVRAEDYLRPASLRFERGPRDPDAFYDDWLDADGLRRDVLDPLTPGGTGRIRVSRWDARTDRASRLGFVEVPVGGVLLLSGPLLLGRGLPLDLTVHLDLSPGALARRISPDYAWTLPSYARYTAEVKPTLVADIVVRMDDPRHPAVSVGEP